MSLMDLDPRYLDSESGHSFDEHGLFVPDSSDNDDDDDDDSYDSAMFRTTDAEMEALINCIQKNDPSTTAINGTNTEDPSLDGRRAYYTRRLGEALLHNTIVTELSVDFEHVLDSNEFDDAAMIATSSPLIRYLRTSPCLSKVWIIVGFGEYPGDRATMVADTILQAVASNPSVQDFSFGVISCGVKISHESWEYLLQTTQSLRSLTLVVDQYQANPQSWQPMAAAFGSNQPLEELCLYSYETKADITEHILLQLGSHTKLQKLNLSMGAVGVAATPGHFDALNHFLRSTISLRALKIDHYSFTEVQLTQFISALNSNANVSSLSFSPASPSLAEWWVRRIPTLAHVKTLSLCGLFVQNGARFGLLRACRENGSLYEIERYRNLCLVREADVLLAYWERNKNVPLLLAKPKLDHDNNDGGDGVDQQDKTAVSLFPSLFQLANHARRLAPTLVLIGLSALPGAAVGYNAGRKRPQDNIVDAKRLERKIQLVVGKILWAKRQPKTRTWWATHTIRIHRITV